MKNAAFSWPPIRLLGLARHKPRHSADCATSNPISELKNMSDRLLKALGAVDEHEALRFIAEANEYMAKVKTVTGSETYEETLAVMTPAVAMSRELTAMTGKSESAEQL